MAAGNAITSVTAAGVAATAAAQSVNILSAGATSVCGRYAPRSPDIIPQGFALVCQQQRWDTSSMWRRLTDMRRAWFEAESGAYIYWNRSDGNWWIDEPSGAGAYIAQSDQQLPPTDGWKPLPGTQLPLPTVELELS